LKNLILIVLFLLAFSTLIAANFEEAKKLYEQQKYEETIDVMKDLLKQDKNNLEYNRLMANSYFALMRDPNPNMFKAMGYLKNTKKYFEKVAELDPTDIDSRVNLANSYFFPPKIAGGNKKKAREFLAELKQLSPKIGMEIEIEFLAYEEEFAQAENLCKNYMNQYPEETDIYYTMAMLYQQEEKYTAAFQIFEDHLLKNPKAYNSMYQIGRTAIFSKSNLERGIECLTKYVDHEPTEEEPGLDSAYWRLGLLYELLSDFDKAKEAFNLGLNINPNSKEIQEELKKYS
jgi:tetratricopeptide (TPR) repeat protein